MSMNEKNEVSAKGILRIRDKETGELILEKTNAINFINMSAAIAYSLTNQGRGTIRKMLFGNGASTTTGIGAITYRPPNVNTSGDSLYNETYAKIVDSTDPTISDSQYNYLTVQPPATNETFSDIVVVCTLAQNEPYDQLPMDNASSASSQYTFNEIGLQTTEGKMISHVIFSPVQKSANRVYEIEYTIRIMMVA